MEVRLWHRQLKTFDLQQERKYCQTHKRLYLFFFFFAFLLVRDRGRTAGDKRYSSIFHLVAANYEGNSTWKTVLSARWEREELHLRDNRWRYGWYVQTRVPRIPRKEGLSQDSKKHRPLKSHFHLQGPFITLLVHILHSRKINVRQDHVQRKRTSTSNTGFTVWGHILKYWQ